MTDEQLLTAFYDSNGEDVASFYTLFERHGNHILARAESRLRKWGLAKVDPHEVLHEVIILVERTLRRQEARWDPEHPNNKGVLPWLGVITFNVCSTFARREGRLQQVFNAVETAEEGLVSPADIVADGRQASPLELCIADEEKQMLDDCISDLPPHQQEVIWCRYWECMTLQQIADLLEYAVSTIHNWHKYAVASLELCLRGKGMQCG